MLSTFEPDRAVRFDRSVNSTVLGGKSVVVHLIRLTGFESAPSFGGRFTKSGHALAKICKLPAAMCGLGHGGRAYFLAQPR